MNETEAQEQVDRIAPVLPELQMALATDVVLVDGGLHGRESKESIVLTLKAVALAARNDTLWSVVDWLRAEAQGWSRTGWRECLEDYAETLAQMLTAAKVGRPEKEA